MAHCRGTQTRTDREGGSIDDKTLCELGQYIAPQRAWKLKKHMLSGWLDGVAKEREVGDVDRPPGSDTGSLDTTFEVAMPDAQAADDTGRNSVEYAVRSTSLQLVPPSTTLSSIVPQPQLLASNPILLASTTTSVHRPTLTRLGARVSWWNVVRGLTMRAS